MTPYESPDRPHPKKPRVTLRDVAEACGVARSTVSGVLNNRPDCYASETVRQKVLTAVERLGYRPSLSARGLVSGRSRMLGFISTGEDVESATRLTIAFERQAREHGYTTMLAFNPNRPDIEDRLAGWFYDLGVDGLAIMPCEEGRHREIHRLVKSGFPVVTIDSQGGLDFDAPCVNCDHFLGGKLQAEHLIHLGRERFLIADGFHTCRVVERRVTGMKQAISDAGLALPERMEVPYETAPLDSMDTEAFNFIEDKFEQRLRSIDAVLATGDSLAFVVAGLLQKLGVRIPDDVAVIGHDSHSFGNQPLLPLSSIEIPAARMGAAACDLLVELTAKRRPLSTGPCPRLTFRPRLIARASTLGAVWTPGAQAPKPSPIVNARTAAAEVHASRPSVTNASKPKEK